MCAASMALLDINREGKFLLRNKGVSLGGGWPSSKSKSPLETPGKKEKVSPEIPFSTLKTCGSRAAALPVTIRQREDSIPTTDPFLHSQPFFLHRGLLILPSVTLRCQRASGCSVVERGCLKSARVQPPWSCCQGQQPPQEHAMGTRLPPSPPAACCACITEAEAGVQEAAQALVARGSTWGAKFEVDGMAQTGYTSTLQLWQEGLWGFTAVSVILPIFKASTLIFSLPIYLNNI